ncbi:MAG: phosphatase PAP2 family protein [Bacteroidota bacterium]|nr:phosphatase PAP2 family protein [Bacteroidota bacterium]
MRKFVFVSITILFSFGCLGQQPDTLIKKLDSLSQKTDSAGGQINNTNPAAYNEYTQMTAPSFFILQGSNVKQAFTKPFHMSGKNWATVGKFALVIGTLAFFDRPIQQWALDLRNSNSGLRNVSHYVTNFGGPYEGYTLGALGAYGFLFKNKKMQTTTLLAAQSYITGAAVQYVVKFLTGRQRPLALSRNQGVGSPAFKGPFRTLKDAEGNQLNGSFPSGHTTVAFAAATVYALEYKNKPWVPVLAYTAASLIGLSRLTENKHWATDVLAGAALGYLTGRQVVNNYHRYAKLRAPKQPRNAVSFSIGYSNGQLLPGMVYRF